MRADEFWSSTVYETREFIRARGEEDERCYQLAIWHAWHVIAFDRSKRLPDLKNLLRSFGSKKKPRKPQTVEQMAEAARFLTIMFGGKDLTEAEKN